MRLVLRASAKIPGNGGLNRIPNQRRPSPDVRWFGVNLWRQRYGLPPLNPSEYVLKEIPLDSVILLQSGEDYDNDSSRETANHYYRVHVLGEEPNYEGDFRPIVIDERGRVIDGHHRHAAHTFLGRKKIWAYVPKSVAEKF